MLPWGNVGYEVSVKSLLRPIFAASETHLMRTYPRCGLIRIAYLVNFILSVLVIIVALCLTRTLNAQTLVYSFESGPGEFNPNGGGLTLAADTIGATHLDGSLRATLVSGATIAGALHGGPGDTLPTALGDPPGVDYVLFDATITEPIPEGAYANLSLTMFGHSQPDYPGGQQLGLHVNDFPDFEPFEDKEPGTYTDIRIDLTGATHPLTFAEGLSYNDIFGTVGSGQDDLIPSGFQIVLRKASGFAWSVYIDNVRLVDLTPDITPGDYNDDGVVDTADYVLWRKLLPTGGTLANDNTPGADAGDYDVWVEHFGEPGAGGGGQAVPEPAAAMMLAVLASFCATARRRAVR
jgi:hypothetical protein